MSNSSDKPVESSVDGEATIVRVQPIGLKMSGFSVIVAVAVLWLVGLGYTALHRSALGTHPALLLVLFALTEGVWIVAIISAFDTGKRSLQFEARPSGLKVSSQGPRGPKSFAWPREQITDVQWRSGRFAGVFIKIAGKHDAVFCRGLAPKDLQYISQCLRRGLGMKE